MIIMGVDQIREGMVVSKDVISPAEVMIIPEGAILTDSNINRIRMNKVCRIIVNRDSIPEHLITNYDHEESVLFVRRQFKNIFAQSTIEEKIDVCVIKEGVRFMIDKITDDGDIMSKIRKIQEYDDYTFRHSLNVAMMCTAVGKWLGYSDVDLENLTHAGLFHDVGKCKVDKNILNKPTKLDDTEMEEMKKHPQHGYNLLVRIKEFPRDIALGVLHHHEREDGEGYPSKIKGDKIHEFGKIIAVCDMFDAMTSDRVYKSKMSPFDAAEYIYKNTFGKLDTRICRLFFDNISKSYINNQVLLNTGERGKIVFLHQNNPNRPIVQVGDKFVDLLQQTELRIIDVTD